jgi:hypothetical protein
MSTKRIGVRSPLEPLNKDASEKVRKGNKRT